MVDNSESRLDRLESLMTQSGEIILRTTELAQQNSEQIQQNSEQLNRLEQLVQRNWEHGNLLQQTMAQLALQAASDRAEFEQHRRTTEAALSKIDRVLDYLMGQQED
ncbi:MAG: hypothetical protein AAGA83_22805 [Cyanobacteria bacterium P01_F01_bin.116]